MPPPDLPTTAKDMFCYGVYTASHAINRAYGPHLKALGLTYPQYITLTLLWERAPQKINELARQMGMETSTLTPLVKRLETMGHVTRTRGDQDKREVFVNLTQKGNAVQAQAPAITSCMIANTSLSHHELDQLQSLLIKLRDGLHSQPLAAR